MYPQEREYGKFHEDQLYRKSNGHLGAVHPFLSLEVSTSVTERDVVYREQFDFLRKRSSA